MNPIILQGALSMVGVNCQEATADLIIEVYKKVEEIGGKFDIETAIEIKGKNLAKYHEGPIPEPTEVIGGEQKQD